MFDDGTEAKDIGQIGADLIADPPAKTYPAPAQDETEHEIQITIKVPVFGRPGDRHDLKAAACVLEAVKLSVDTRATGVICGTFERPGSTEIPTMAQIIGKDS